MYKLIKLNDALILLKIRSTSQGILVEFPFNPPSISIHEEVASYIWQWFDLRTDLNHFYEVARQDAVLYQFPQKYYGLRIMGIPDLFEALSWAIMGQQINLTFAYTLKRRLIECFGESLTINHHTYWLFPTYKKISAIDVEDLRKLQFTTRKAEYIIGVAKIMASGELTKEALLKKQDYHLIQKSLMQIRGIGTWTADYVMMKCLHHPSAFPIADVGLHNALKSHLGLACKPTIDDIKKMAINWKKLGSICYLLPMEVTI